MPRHHAHRNGAGSTRRLSYHDALGYGPTEKGFDRVLSVAVFPKHVNLGFISARRWDDPKGLLPGEGRRMRHVKLRTVDDARRREVRQFVREAKTVELSGSVM